MRATTRAQRTAYPNSAPAREAKTTSPLPMVREAMIAPGPKNVRAVPTVMRPRRFSGGAGIWMASSLSTCVCMVLLSRCSYSTLSLRDKIGHIDATAPAHLPQLRGRLRPDGHARRLSLVLRPVLDLAGEEELLSAFGL